MKSQAPNKTTKLAMIIAQLQTTLDVYDGLFNKEEDAKKIGESFPDIYQSISQSMRVHIIIGCAAVFTDPSKDSQGNQNLSLKNLEEMYSDAFKEDTKNAIKEVFDIVKNMNLKKYRNKHVVHLSLEEIMGGKHVSASINIDNIRELLHKTHLLLNKIAHDAKFMPNTEVNSFYREIPIRQSTTEFLNRISQKSDGK